MIELRQNQAVRVPVRLMVGSTPVTGVVSPVVYMHKAVAPGTPSGGASELKVITLNLNWFEIDAINLPGVYELELSASDVDTLGGLEIGVKGGNGTQTSDVFVAVFHVEGHLLSDLYSALVLATKYMANRTKIDSTNGTFTIYDDDGSTPLRVFDLKDDTGTSTGTNIYERVPR